MDTQRNYSTQYYQELLEKIINKTASPEEVQLVEELVLHAAKEVEQILTADDTQ